MRWRRVCESRPGQRCASDIQLNDSLVWFRSVKLNSGPTHWLCPWTSWWLIFFFLLSGFLWQPLKWTERIEQLLPTPNPNPSLQHVQCILCMSYIESVRLVFLRAKPLLPNETTLTERLFQLHWVTHYMHHLSCDVFFLSLSPWKIGSLSNHMQCASPPLSFEEIIMWHYKETQRTSPLKPPFMSSRISRHRLEGLKIVSIMNVAPGGKWEDIWMWEHVEGSPQCTEQSPWAMQSFMSVFKDSLWSESRGILRFREGIRQCADQLLLSSH